MAKTKSELHQELENLEVRLRDEKKTRKSIAKDSRERIKEITDQIDQVLEELETVEK